MSIGFDANAGNANDNIIAPGMRGSQLDEELHIGRQGGGRSVADKNKSGYARAE